MLILANSSANFLKKNIELHIYLNNHISENERIKVTTLLSSKAYVNKVNQKADVHYISQQEAHQKFISETGEDFTKILDISPVRASVIIKINPAFSKVKQLKKLKGEIESLSGVFEVDLNEKKESQVEAIHRNIKNISLFLVIFAIISLLTIIFLINNTIKLALFSQRFLIRSMQLVGATSSFIQKPFIKRGALYGLIGGLISSTIIYGLLNLANKNFEDFEILYTDSFETVVMLLGIIPLLGMFITILSSYWAISKYLKMSLDELY